MKRKITLVVLILLVPLAFAYGLWLGVAKKPPYTLVRSIYREWQRARGVHLSDPKYSTIDERYYETDLDSLVEIHTRDGALDKRRQLIEFIWKGGGFPARADVAVAASIEDDRYADIEGLRSIDRYTVDFDHGINSVAYHFNPSAAERGLVVYHQGHFGDFVHGKETIRHFLDGGYSVLAFAMPLLGMNSRPIVSLERFGRVKFQFHSNLRLLDSPTHSSIRYFVEPVAVALNYIEPRYDYPSVTMVGISGGGWTTILYAAIDPRIVKSYPVASASYPMFLREISDDYEQVLPELYRTANYIELYILGALEPQRRQLQVFNRYDTSCCWGIRFEVYEGKVKSVLEGIGGGRFGVFLDSSHMRHMISPLALETIMQDMEGRAPQSTTP